MKRCLNCLSECPDSATVCTACGFDGEILNKYQYCLPVGTKINGRYLLGGVTEKTKVFATYFAYDAKLGKRVKLTEYLPERYVYRNPDEESVRFLDEDCRLRADREIASLYSHYGKLCEVSKSSVLNFTDTFASNSTVYFANSVESGIPFSSMVGNGKAMPFDKAVEMLVPVFDCLSKMREYGKWHGSVTPYSILTKNGKVTALTGYSYPPKYTASPFDAPEKQVGAGKCGSFTDVYSLGAILYQASTGYLPLSASQMEKGRVLPFPENFPEKQKEIILGAMNPNERERYADVDEFAVVLGIKNPVKEKKKPTASGIIRKIILAVAIICLLISGAYLLNYYVIEPMAESKQAEELSNLIQTTVDDTEVYIDPWEEIQKRHPDVLFPDRMNPAFADLYAINNEFAGWVSIPSLNINYSVLQTTDNDKYLRRDIYGNRTSYGVPYFDYRNAMKKLDKNTIIYGHNMRHDDKIFGTLEEYRTLEGFRKAPLIGMSTLYNDYTFKVYAVFISNSIADDDNGHIFNYIFTQTSNERFMDYVREIDKRKLYTTGVDIKETDKILTLSTCCYDFEDGKLVVVGRLLRPEETTEIDFSKAYMNDNPKFPQAYYDAKRIDNPYINDPDEFNYEW